MTFVAQTSSNHVNNCSCRSLSIYLFLVTETRRQSNLCCALMPCVRALPVDQSGCNSDSICECRYNDYRTLSVYFWYGVVIHRDVTRTLPAAAPTSYLEFKYHNSAQPLAKTLIRGGRNPSKRCRSAHTHHPQGYRIRNGRPSPPSRCTTRLLALPFCLCCRPG